MPAWMGQTIRGRRCNTNYNIRVLATHTDVKECLQDDGGSDDAGTEKYSRDVGTEHTIDVHMKLSSCSSSA